MNIKVRPATPVDMPFIYATWLKGVYYGNSWFRQIDKQEFFKSYHTFLEKVLAGANVLVACLEDDEDVIVGYLVHRSFVLDWVFVKKSWRRIGVAKLLMAVAECTFTIMTHITPTGKKIAGSKIKFNPFI